MSSGSGDIREKRKVEKRGLRVFLLLTVPIVGYNNTIFVNVYWLIYEIKGQKRTEGEQKKLHIRNGNTDQKTHFILESPSDHSIYIFFCSRYVVQSSSVEEKVPRKKESFHSTIYAVKDVLYSTLSS